MRCDQEICQYWSGDGDVCPCALFGLGKYGPQTIIVDDDDLTPSDVPEQP